MKTWISLPLLGILLAAAVNGAAQPVLTCQPTNHTAIAGSNVTFTVCATGTPPLSYQWRSHASGINYTNIPFGTEATLVLTNVQPTTRRFAVVVTDGGGLSVTSSPFVTLTVLMPPIITMQPTSLSVEVGGTASFSVVATGTPPLALQWRLNALDMNGKTNASLTLINVQSSNAGPYTVVVTNSAGSVTSQVATLTLFDTTTFTKITSGSIANSGGNSFGCAWGDYDDDGWLDLYVVNCCGLTNFLYHNNGDGTFSRVTNGIIANDSANGGVGVWGDYDNDGALDLFATSYSPRQNLLYHNNGDGTFAKITNSPAVTNLGNFASAVWGDFDNDGFIDLYVVNQNQLRNFLFRNNGDGTFTAITNDPIVVNDGGFYGCAWGDYDNDGYLDFFICDNAFDNSNRLYRNQHGTFTVTTNLNVAGGSHGSAWGDYNNDGYLDLFVANGGGVGGRANFLYRNNGNGAFTRITTGIVVNDVGTSESCAWADYDNDGFLDLFVTNFGQNGVGANNFLYRNNGDDTFAKVTAGNIVNDGGASLGCSWGDFDNDGFPDVFVANLHQNNVLYRNNGNSNSWIKIKCIGALSNRSAIGAKVRVKAVIGGMTRWQMREISGGSGYVSQNSLDVTVGLGDATNIDTVRIEWPSGTVQELHDVAPKQFLTVTEPPRLQILGLTDAGFQLQIAGGRNFRYGIDVSTNLANWAPLVTLTNLGRTTVFTDTDGTNAPRRFYRAVSP